MPFLSPCQTCSSPPASEQNAERPVYYVLLSFQGGQDVGYPAREVKGNTP
ncbi:hypothetical protein ApDm4_0843 [Acetobacter pomorum]|nr:hypothetical protein ApDm4_0843 [Acetobacter pomorum]